MNLMINPPTKHPRRFPPFAVLVSLWRPLARTPALPSDVTLEDPALRVSFDTDSGALTRLESKATHWTVERRPELGVSFRLHAPLPDRRDNFVLGQKQQAAEVKKSADHEVRLVWRNPVSEHGGVLPLTFTATVTLENGGLTFNWEPGEQLAAHGRNHRLPLFWRPRLADPSAPLQSEHMWYGNPSPAKSIHAS